MKVSTSILLCFLLAGCSSSNPANVTLQREYLTVIGGDGEQMLISADDLMKETGDPAVLVIDRHTGTEVWVTLQKLRAEPPATSRYIPVARPETSLHDQD